MTTTFQPIQVQKCRLAGSGCTSSATSIILQSLKYLDGSTVTTADIDSLCFATIEPGTSKEESIKFTGITQNADGTATLTGVTRGLDFAEPYTEVAGNKLSHAGGSIIVFSNTSAFYGNIKTYADEAAAQGAADADETTKGISKLSVAPASSTNPIAVGDNDPRLLTTAEKTDFDNNLPSDDEKAAMAGGGDLGTPSASNKFVTEEGVANKADIKFGGTGADGALAITTGTTTIDLGGEAVVTKNYTSISITGDGKLAFSNPHANGTIIILKSQGNVTLTSSQAPMIDASGMGADTGTAGYGLYGGTTGVPDVGSATPTGYPGGSGATALNPTFLNTSYFKIGVLFVGSGGANGGTTLTPGAGGRGGAGLFIECCGAWNFTTASGISVAGKDGTDGQGNTVNVSGGGGGGGGGRFLALYNSLTSNTGTITVSGGAGGKGGDGGDGSVNAAGGGGGGAGYYAGGAGGNGDGDMATGGTGGTGGAGGTTGAGSGGNAPVGVTGGGGGGGGGAGLSLVALNTEFS